jgi:acyl-CoA synthetase (AMP-forming)/AMP-acid ligase II
MSFPKLGYYPGKNEKNNVYSFLAEHAKNNPHRSILKWVDKKTLTTWDHQLSSHLAHLSLSVIELFEMSNRLAKGLTDLGIKPGDRVILFIPMSTYLYSTMFALQKIGAIPTFLDSWARRGQLGVSAEAVSPKAMISFEMAFDLCKEETFFHQLPIKVVVGSHQGNYQSSIEKLLQSTGETAICPVEQEDTALITFTTGSSGTPKGANRTHRFLAAQHYALHRCIPYSNEDIDLPVFPIFSLNNLAEGVPTVIPAFDVGVPSPHDALIICAQIKANGVTCVTLSPSLLNGLSRFCLDHKIQLPQLRRVVTGGAPVSRDNLIDICQVAPAAQVWVLYGSTEVEPIAHIEAQAMIHQKSSSEIDPELEDEGVNVGHIDEGLNYKFIKIEKGIVTIKSDLDWKKIEVATGAVGELVVSGEHVCRDYFNNEEAFYRAKIKDHQGIVWHRTGDLGRKDSQGNLWLVGRVHNAINRGGEYFFPVRTEIILKKLPFVRYCAYLGVPDSALGEKTVCVLQLHENQQSKENLNYIQNETERILNKNKIVFDQIILNHSIPMDPRHHSKVEYHLLRESLQKEGLI